ncbi:uncharacterized protein TNCV_5069161 [Trichonephila clavipes]|nr:uncharacterized protein TNCV_5069161 [Trichonephila clavipes]
MVRPTDVRITSPYQPLSAGKDIDIVCVARGARPPAQISWWLDGEKLTTKITESTAEEDNLTISSLNIRPTIQDNLRNLSCRGDNPQLTESVLEDTWLISVHYLPRLSVKMNTLDTVKEGSEVSMTCEVHSLPPVTELEWLQDGRSLGPPVGANFLNRTLIIPSAGPQHRGEYQCAGTNSEGRSVSDPVLLQVLYVPRCESVRSSVYGVGRTESVSVTCEVDAYPNVVNFSWVLSNSDKHSPLPSTQFSSNGTKSVATVSPRVPQDYGILQCRASNVIGQQKDPCSFRIIPAGSPTRQNFGGCVINGLMSIEPWKADRHQVVFSDESHFNLWDRESHIRVRCYASKSCFPECVIEQHSCLIPGVMFWGVISHRGRSNLIRIKDNLNSSMYVREVLQPEVVPSRQCCSNFHCWRPNFQS